MPTRRYEPAPAPQPPDEDYWLALLEQADQEDVIPSDENVEWSELKAVLATEAGAHFHSSEIDQDWQEAEQAYQKDLTVKLKVFGFNRGGVLVEWGNLRGFVPASQLLNHEEDDLSLNHIILGRYVGQTLPLRVIELNKAQNRLIFSQRAAQVSPGTRAAILRQLEAGACVQGIVTNICDFGVFIDLGGVEGLIHISELSWGRVEHPSELVERGQQVQVYIISVDQEECRIALSLKRLQPDPWHTVEQRYRVGHAVEGTITSVVDFGAFACLEAGLEGLIHISELAEGHFLHPRNVVQAGQKVTVRILNIDSQTRRIGLSLRGIKQNGDGQDQA